jgi:hypothetical protein
MPSSTPFWAESGKTNRSDLHLLLCFKCTYNGENLYSIQSFRSRFGSEFVATKFGRTIDPGMFVPWSCSDSLCTSMQPRRYAMQTPCLGLILARCSPLCACAEDSIHSATANEFADGDVRACFAQKALSVSSIRLKESICFGGRSCRHRYLLLRAGFDGCPRAWPRTFSSQPRLRCTVARRHMPSVQWSA